MQLSFFTITKRETFIIKGIAIVMIVLHNYLHITNYAHEMEMGFIDNATSSFIRTLFLSGPILPIIFSYLGHYGVQLFIFISGYGLMKKMMKEDKISFAQYIVPLLKKIYLLVCIGIIFNILLMILGAIKVLHFEGVAINLHTIIERIRLMNLPDFIVSTLLMYNNFSFGRLLLYVGPWWYFSLAIQLYFIFPFLYKIINKYDKKGVCILFASSYVLIYILSPLCAKYNIPLYANFVGHVPEFLLGMVLARYSDIRITWKLLLAAIVVFAASNFVESVFPFSFLSVSIILLCLIHPIYSRLSDKNAVGNALYFVGSISMCIFVINGPIRYKDMYALSLLTSSNFLAACIHLLIVIPIAYILFLIYTKMIKLLLVPK